MMYLNNSFENYMNFFLKLYDKHFPQKQFTFKEKHNKPYITQAIQQSIKHRNKLQKLYAKWPITYGKIFKDYRNTLTSTIRAAKENYIKSKLQNNTGNLKKTWDIINFLMGKFNTRPPDQMSFQGNILNDHKEIAESFNEYFSNVANNLARNIEQPSEPYTS